MIDPHLRIFIDVKRSYFLLASYLLYHHSLVRILAERTSLQSVIPKRIDNHIVISLAAAVAKYCDACVCLSVCLSVCVCPRGISPEPHARSLPIFVQVAHVRGSVLLRHVDNRPHRLSPGRGVGSAQRGRSASLPCYLLIFFTKDTHFCHLF